MTVVHSGQLLVQPESSTSSWGIAVRAVVMETVVEQGQPPQILMQLWSSPGISFRELSTVPLPLGQPQHELHATNLMLNGGIIGRGGLLV